MKTNFKNQKRNNFQSAVLRSGAVIASLVLISFAVSAQEFWKGLLTNSSLNQIALALVETPAEVESSRITTETSNVYYYLNEEEDPALELEDWMTNDNHFGFSPFGVEQVQDEPLGLEDWMTNNNHFRLAEEQEKELLLEAWMTSEEYWK